MKNKIHTKAIVSKKAELGDDVEVGPYAIIEDRVIIGSGTKIGANSVIHDNVSVGKNCKIFPGAVLGSEPQDRKYKGEKSFLEIGDGNTIRECVTFNIGTKEGSKTVIGNNNLFMAYSHVAHDCVIGNNCILANGATLAGHIVIEDKALISGLVAVHQFVRIGTLSIVGGCSKVVQDIPPFSTCDGHPARIFGLNLVGLKRNNVPHEIIDKLKHAYRILFRSGLILKHALLKMEQERETAEEVTLLVNFLKGSSRGVSRYCRGARLCDESSPVHR